MVEKQTNYTIAEGVTLPSNGLIYSVQIDPNVELRSMTARDEMKRLAPSNTPLKVLAEIIDGCIVNKLPISVYDMAMADYEFLLHKLRIVTYGEDYKIGVTCAECYEDVETVTHLDQMEVTPLDYDKFEELRHVTLPKSGSILTLNFSTPRMVEEADSRAKEYKRRFKDAPISFDTFATLVAMIDTVNGNTLSLIEKENFINKLPAADMLKLINTYEKLNSCFGIKNELIVDCPSCGAAIKTFFRFGPEFFRPSTI